MNKEECMLALEQIILELPQYRKITNNLCNRYISDFVRNEYEQKQIYIEGDHNSSIDYCWDVYNNVPIDVIESILDYLKEQNDIKDENTNLKQALIDIREYCNTDEFKSNFESFGNERNLKDVILQIIDKALGGSDELYDLIKADLV